MPRPASERDTATGNGNGHATPPANFLEWSYRTFGDGITEHFMKPYNFKVWGIAPERMSSDWINGRVLTPSLDEVIEGAISRGGPTWAPTPASATRSRAAARCSSRASPAGQRPGAGAFTLNRTLVRLDPKRRRATFRVEEPGALEARLETIGYEHALPEHPPARPDRRHRRRARRRPQGRRAACPPRPSSASTSASTARRSPRSTGSTTPRARTSSSSSASSSSRTPRRRPPPPATAP